MFVSQVLMVFFLAVVFILIGTTYKGGGWWDGATRWEQLSFYHVFVERLAQDQAQSQSQSPKEALGN